VKLLILDEWLLIKLRHDDARYNQGPTIFVSQFTTDGWHSKISDPTLADAILNRIVRNAYTILIDGEESMRERKGIS
jgi:DNA replication protein DnaC